jgi:hypothetical protein
VNDLIINIDHCKDKENYVEEIEKKFKESETFYSINHKELDKIMVYAEAQMIDFHSTNIE